MKNHSSITIFILLGLTDNPRLQAFLSVFLFLTYMSTIAGNLVIILLTLVSSHLKIPMYFFPMKLLHLRNNLDHCLHSSIPVQHDNWRQKSDL